MHCGEDTLQHNEQKRSNHGCIQCTMHQIIIRVDSWIHWCITYSCMSYICPDILLNADANEQLSGSRVHKVDELQSIEPRHPVLLLKCYSHWSLFKQLVKHSCYLGTFARNPWQTHSTAPSSTELLIVWLSLLALQIRLSLKWERSCPLRLGSKRARVR